MTSVRQASPPHPKLASDDDMPALIDNSGTELDDEAPVPRVVVLSSPGFNPGETRNSRETVESESDDDMAKVSNWTLELVSHI